MRSKTAARALGLAVLLSAAAVPADTPSVDADTEWLESDTLSPPGFDVNEGELRFIHPLPEAQIPYSENVLAIARDSLATGWLDLTQCHHRLDAVPELEIVYRYSGMRDLRIVERKRIGHAEVVGDSVQMADLERGNRLCVQARIRVLQRTDDHAYRLRSGPYHRQFLDGFYPYHVSLRVSYPSDALEVVEVAPLAQPGFEVSHVAGRIDIDAWFEGRLTTEIGFRRRSPRR